MQRVGNLVAFRVRRVGATGQRLVMGQLGVEADEEVVVVQVGEGSWERRGEGKGSYVVESDCGCQSWVVLDVA